jgi:hypothetical protein
MVDYVDRNTLECGCVVVCWRGLFDEIEYCPLHAAAPAMLEALELAISTVRYYHEHEGCPDTLKKCRAAIALARSGSAAPVAPFSYAKTNLDALVSHVLAMADDAYLVGHPEWLEIVADADQAARGQKITR